MRWCPLLEGEYQVKDHPEERHTNVWITVICEERRDKEVAHSWQNVQPDSANATVATKGDQDTAVERVHFGQTRQRKQHAATRTHNHQRLVRKENKKDKRIWRSLPRCGTARARCTGRGRKGASARCRWSHDLGLQKRPHP
ncbi:hypothetical protein NDU88_007438 [Pleurodeles waltl]|uniref:Uncharacterized protein n=1 Tax=Pleurodeles waltl TaxID=8319 RepID=A0AAV7PNY2_PLEWA|nr:hypothetical protein NDU88_007438 [Pleurodeles waltl]